MLLAGGTMPSMLKMVISALSFLRHLLICCLPENVSPCLKVKAGFAAADLKTRARLWLFDCLPARSDSKPVYANFVHQSDLSALRSEFGAHPLPAGYPAPRSYRSATPSYLGGGQLAGQPVNVKLGPGGKYFFPSSSSASGASPPWV